MVVALVGPLTVTSVSAGTNPPKPKPAKPIGPGPYWPLDSYGSTLSDNVVLKWNDQALAAIRTVFPAAAGQRPRPGDHEHQHLRRLDGL